MREGEQREGGREGEKGIAPPEKRAELSFLLLYGSTSCARNDRNLVLFTRATPQDLRVGRRLLGRRDGKG